MPSISTCINVLYIVGSVACLVAYLVLATKGRTASRWPICCASFGLICFATTVFFQAVHSESPFDFNAFRSSGQEVRDGRDPIDSLALSPLPPLNPPSAYPLFALFAFGSQSQAFGVWTIFSAVLAIGLVCLTQAIFVPRLGSLNGLDRNMFLILTAVVCLSNAVRATLASGQFGIFEAFLIIVALYCRERSMPALAGLFLAFSTMKIGTMVPFMLLFCQRRDRVSWLVMIVATAALCLTTGKAIETPNRIQTWLSTISRLSGPGQLNDFSYAIADNGDMIGLDHAFYRLGLKDRSHAKLAQMTVLVLLGVWLAFEVIGRERLSPGAKTSLVTCYSILFLYHRLPDAIVLVIPLVYATIHAQVTAEKSRKLYLAAAFALLPVLFMQRQVMKHLREIGEGTGLISRVVEAVLTPYACWLILLTMALIACAEYRESSKKNLTRIEAST